MTIKLMLLKSGEDLIADIREMVVGENEERRVIGYYLTRPCIVKMLGANHSTEETDGAKKSGFQVSLYPWMPLSADNEIPIPADWMVTMVEPTAKLKEMYITDVINYGKQNDQTSNSDESTDSIGTN